MSMSVRALMLEPQRSGSRTIVRVSKEEPHTLVVKQGGACACLRFTETIVAAELLEYCENHLGWPVRNLPFVVDGKRFTADQAATVALIVNTERVDVGEVQRPSIFEVTRDVGSKGL